MIESRLVRVFRVVLAAVIVTAFVAVAAPAGAATNTYYIDPVGGNDGAAGTSEATAFKTIAHAAGIVGGNDTIIALPGTYSASTNGESLPINLLPSTTLKSRDGADTTILDGEGVAAMLQITDATTNTEVSGFTIKNGDAALLTGGIRILRTSTNSVPGWPLINNNTFEDNNGQYGGAIYVAGKSDGHAEPTIRDNDFINNHAAVTGGAIFLNQHADADVRNNYFRINDATDGGAIGIRVDCELTATGNTFDTNDATAGAGGAIYAASISTVTAGDNYFVDNTSSGTGGAIQMNYGRAEIYANEFSGNQSGGAGGAINLNIVSDADIYNNMIYGNTGGGTGGAIRCDDSAVDFSYNTVYGNTGTAYSAVYTMGGTFTLRACIVWGHADDALSGTTISYTYTDDTNLLSNNTVGAGVVDTDPKFFDAANDDFRLQVGSPCIDAGTGGPASDFAGTTRPQDGNDDGAALYDFGAWERPQLDVARVAGSDRYSTAADAAVAAFGTADTAVIASGQNFPDALSAAGLCGVHDAPLLLTRTASLPAATAQALSDMGVSDVVIVGGTGAVSAAVETALKADYTVTRIFGADRYSTAAKVAEEIESIQGPMFNQWAYVARGDAFPDALAVSPYSFNAGTPILLTRPGSLPPATKAALEDLLIDDAIVLGGTGAVSDTVKGEVDDVLEANSGFVSARWFGTDRYATAAKIASNALASNWCDSAYLGVATGVNFPDALAGGVATGARNGSVLLTRTSVLPTPTETELSARGPKVVWCEIFGGTGAVSDAVRSDIWTALGW